jgi:hypothetical protein
MPAGTYARRMAKIFRQPIVLTILLSALVHALLLAALLQVLETDAEGRVEAGASVLELTLNTTAAVNPAAAQGMPPINATAFPSGKLSAGVSSTDSNSEPEQSQPQTLDVSAGQAVAALPEAAAAEPLPPQDTPLQRLPSQDLPGQVVMSETASIADVEIVGTTLAADSQIPMTAFLSDEPGYTAAPATLTEESFTAPVHDISANELEVLESGIISWISELQAVQWQQNTLQLAHEGETFEVEAELLPAADNMALNQIHLEISVIRDGQRHVSHVQVRETAFSHYAKFINSWDPDVRLSDDWVGGRFHSNSPIIMAERGARPVFTGLVTVAARQSLSRRVRESPIFAGGVETGARAVPLPRNIPLPPDNASEHAVVIHYFEKDTSIAFQASGEYLWQTDDGSRSGKELLAGEAVYLIARNNARLSVAGQVNGRVLVYSPRRITITGELLYATDPRQIPESEDFLGLVSDGSVEIAEASVTGPGDLVIQAAIFARSRFSVRRFRDREQGVLRIFGSLTAGSVSATEPRFSTRVEHDGRLVDRRPPSFPVTGNFELASWDRQWRIQE